MKNFIYYVVVSREEGNMVYSVSKLDLKSSDTRNYRILSGRTFVGCNSLLYNEIIQDKPDSIIFERFGCEYVARDSFKAFLSDRSESTLVLMNDKGKLFYSRELI